MQQQDDREQFLQQAHLAVLATLGPGYRLHAMPVWYLYEDGMFIILTGRGSQKHRNIERHKDVTLVIDRRDLPYYAVMVQGSATIGPAPSQALRLRMAVRYLGEERGTAYNARRLDADSVMIQVRPEKFVEYHGVAGRPQSGI
jgi:PPOX class probable F420-dependent enzyme